MKQRSSAVVGPILSWMVLLVGLAHADVGSGDADSVAPAREAYKFVKDRLATVPSQPEVLCISDDRPIWRRVGRRPAELGPGCWSVVSIYRIDGGIRKAVLEQGSQSGDSASIVEFYFFPSGRTAFRYERLSTTHGGEPGGTPWPPGPYAVETRTYYSGAGKKIRELKNAYVEASGKPVSERFVEQFGTPYFESSAGLPRPNRACSVRALDDLGDENKSAGPLGLR